ncbi:MAG TPA: GAF domain-containing protein [Solirubrobacteraceae bacterium]|nr:GAF domain-containing protein [Solirubrobacteraceae bacterium]
MALPAESPSPNVTELHGLREENRTLYGVIRLVSSSLELAPMLQGVVDLATEATGSHACFIYLVEGPELVIRAASPVFSEAVGNVRFSVQEGLAGWVARHRRPEFIRDRAMQDPRMKYVPLLEEESFQSMAAVPVLSRAGETIGVIVLHTRAPHEFGEDTPNLLTHIASLVSGAIENAQLYDRERRRVDSLTGLSELAQQVAAAPDAGELGEVLVRGTAALLDADACQLLRVAPDGETVLPYASHPETLPAPALTRVAEVMLAGLESRSGPARRAAGRALWPSEHLADVLVTPLAVGPDRVGVLCVASAEARAFSDEDAEISRAIAHLAAVAIKRAELIEGLTKANTIKDLFEALAAGATTFAAAKAAEVRCDLNAPYLVLSAQPAGSRAQSTSEWRVAAEALGRGLGELTPRAAVEAGPGPVRALLAFGSARHGAIEGLLRDARELGQAHSAVIGVSELRDTPDDAPGAYREASDAATIAHALLRDGGAIAYSQVGAYRYLVQIGAEDAPRDRMRAAVDLLIEYDRRRRTSLLDTLERYLSERRSVIESARALYVHPNTLRQRLGRIEELTGLDLNTDDLLSLELAIKLARLHGRPDAPA